jgi:hypothetical protein
MLHHATVLAPLLDARKELIAFACPRIHACTLLHMQQK